MIQYAVVVLWQLGYAGSGKRGASRVKNCWNPAQTRPGLWQSRKEQGLGTLQTPNHQWEGKCAWDSGKQLRMGFGENFGAIETLWAEESSFPKHEPSKKRHLPAPATYSPTVTRRGTRLWEEMINVSNHTKWFPAVIMYRAAVTDSPRASRVKIAE